MVSRETAVPPIAPRAQANLRVLARRQCGGFERLSCDENGRTGLGGALPRQAPTLMAKNRGKGTERLIYGRGVREYIEDVRIDDNHVRALRVAGCGNASYGPGEVVLRAHGIAIAHPLPAASVLLHIASAPFASRVAPK